MPTADQKEPPSVPNLLALERVLEILTRRPRSLVALLVRDNAAAQDAFGRLVGLVERWSRGDRAVGTLTDPAGHGVRILTPYLPRDEYRYVFDAVVQSCPFSDLHGPLVHVLKQHRTAACCEWWTSMEGV